MDIHKLDDVNKAVKIIKRIDSAIEKLKYSYDAEKEPDCGGIAYVAEYGYSLHISNHPDGSGCPIDLAGCYIAEEVKEAVAQILTDKRDELITFLNYCGVDTNP